MTKLPIDEFLELYTTSLNELRIDKLWLAYVAWRPEITFEEFCNKSGVETSTEKEEGFYIDQIGM